MVYLWRQLRHEPKFSKKCIERLEAKETKGQSVNWLQRAGHPSDDTIACTDDELRWAERMVRDRESCKSMGLIARREPKCSMPVGSRWE